MFAISWFEKYRQFKQYNIYSAWCEQPLRWFSSVTMSKYFWRTVHSFQWCCGSINDSWKCVGHWIPLSICSHAKNKYLCINNITLSKLLLTFTTVLNFCVLFDCFKMLKTIVFKDKAGKVDCNLSKWINSQWRNAKHRTHSK